MFKKFSTYICWKKYKMGCLEGSGVPVLYIGRTVPKGYGKHQGQCLSGPLQPVGNHPGEVG
jgi:hypothetical protein